MCRRLKVFFISLFAAVLFCLPVSAEFNSSDSVNLSSIKSACDAIERYAQHLDYLFYPYGSTPPAASLYTFLSDIRNTVVSLLDAVNKLSGGGNSLIPESYGPDPIFYLDTNYFSSCWLSTGYIPVDSQGVFTSDKIGSSFQFTLTSEYTLLSYFFQPGTYYLVLNVYMDGTPTSLSISGIPVDFDITSDWGNSNLKYISGTFTVAPNLVSGRDLSFLFSGANVIQGQIFGAVYRATDDSLAGNAINPSQDGIVSSVNDAGNQQQQQEDELWTNVNNYKTDLTFNLDSWSDAANGLSYVSGVFMVIWDNSPTQIIILSLMLGIAMLAIGRGVMAAVRVSNRNSRRNSQDSG